MAEVSSKTPRYVLRHGLQVACPSFSKSRSGMSEADVADLVTDAVIFGFTDKPQYDAFLKGDTKHLTPYPLVKRFLIDQIDKVDHRVGSKLLVLDAEAPSQKVMQATTFEAVLKSLQDGLQSVPITHRLVRDEVDDSSCQYRIERSIAIG